MYKRKIYQEMIAWKQSLSRKKTALVIKGARQIGKTFIVDKFAHDNYENVVYINFSKNQKIKSCFNEDLDVDNIISLISANTANINFIPYKTVIIFDEVQDCSNARSSIKFFCEDGRFDIIATGSSLGINGYSKKSDASIPVGSEYFINMKPMDFEEFLWANGYQEKDIEMLKKFFLELKPLPQTIIETYNKLFKYYICVGGMPEAVKTFIETKDFNQVRITQKSIITSNESDFGKHLNNEEKPYVNTSELQKIREVFYSIPYQLAQESSKFQFNLVKQGKKYRDYESSIRWLCDAELISLCHNVRNVQYPLEGYAINNAFKIYMQDSGLLMSMFDGDIYDAIISGDMQTYKGYIYENIIADAFAKNSIPLFYYNNKYEIDFLTQFNLKICPIEVKAKDGNSKSLKALMNHPNYSKEIIFAIMLKQGNIGFNNNILTIPHFLAFLVNQSFIKEVITKNNLNKIKQ